ncbi:MAG: hypothetical protein AMXMBFR77_28080 [Phycisphaerales bacterium]
MGRSDKVTLTPAQAYGLTHLGRGSRRLLRSRRKYVLYAGGLGAGKSFTGAVKGQQLQTINGAGHAWIVAQVVSVHETGLMGETTKLLDAFRDRHGWGVDIRRVGGQLPQIRYVNGGVQHFIGEGYARNNRGSNLAYAIIDELTKLKDDMDTFTQVRGRVRGAWPFKQVVCMSNLDYGESGVIGHFVAEVEKGNPRYDIIFAPSWENYFLDPEYVTDQMVGKSRTWVAAMLVGALTKPQASVYPEWDPAVHVVPWDPVRDGSRKWLKTGPVEALPWGLGADWGGRPGLCVYQRLALDSECRVYHPESAPPGAHQGLVFVDEDVTDYGGNHRTKAGMAAFIQRATQRFRRGPSWCASDREDPEMNHELWRLVPARCEKWIAKTIEQQEVWPGIERVRSLLDPLEGPPLLYVTEELMQRPSSLERGIGASFKLYRRRFDQQSQTFVSVPVQDEVSEHAMDMVRYPVVQLFGQVRGTSFRFEDVVSHRTHGAAAGSRRLL